MADNPIKISTKNELSKILGETFINRTSKVNKVSPNSVLSALIEGAAEVSAKAMKDIALAASQLFPSLSVGESLDRAANDYGVAPRYGAAKSSVVVKIIAAPGTVYTAIGSQVSGNGGVVYELQEDVTVGSSGIAYAKARSTDSGEFTSVRAYEITSISPVPSGHVAITNEYASTGGRDIEPDDEFRNRILKGANIAAVGTLEKYAQVFRTVNENVLKVFYYGHNSQGKIKLGVVAQNGMDFTQSELDTMLQAAAEYLSLNEMNPTNTNSYGLSLVNVAYQYIDVEFRAQLYQGADTLQIIRSLQAKFSKTVDFRFWKPGIDKIEWEDLLAIVKRETGIRYAPDTYFIPGGDILIDAGKLPRFRSFILKDLNGNILQDASAIIAPIFYPGQTLVDFKGTVLS